MLRPFFLAALVAHLATIAGAGSLKDIEHVILFMQGMIRDWSQKCTWDLTRSQRTGLLIIILGPCRVSVALTILTFRVMAIRLSGISFNKNNNNQSYTTPWYLNFNGTLTQNQGQCARGPASGFEASRRAFNDGANNKWPIYESNVSVGFFQGDDIPTQYALADNWIIADMYQVCMSKFQGLRVG